MEKLVTEEETDDRNNEISLAIDSISYRFGAAGRERKEHIKESYKHIFNLAVPSIHRYLLWAAHHHTHLFAPLPVPQDNDPQVASIRSAREQERKITKRSLQVGSGLDLTSLEDNEKWFGEMKEMLGDLSCKADRILFHQNQLQERRERLISLILRLCETKNCNERQASDLDNLFLDVRDILTPIQCANFILFIEKYAYRHELRYHERALIDDPDEPAPRKLSKLD